MSRKMPRIKELRLERPLLSSSTSEVNVQKEEHPSLLTSTPWPNTPAPLQSRISLPKILEPLCDIFLSALALLFIVFGVLVQRAHGHPTDSVEYAARLLSAAKYV